MMTRFISLLITACSLFAFGNAQSTNGLTIQTQQGAVTGSLVLPTVRRFLGVPYATAGRWQPPASPPLRSVAFNATQFADSCVQNLGPASAEFLTLTGAGLAPIPESDNCLNLNIWAPSTERKQSTAVLVWIYGGSFQFGTVSLSCSTARVDLFADGLFQSLIFSSMTERILFETMKILPLLRSITARTSLDSQTPHNSFHQPVPKTLACLISRLLSVGSTLISVHSVVILRESLFLGRVREAPRLMLMHIRIPQILLSKVRLMCK